MAVKILMKNKNDISRQLVWLELVEQARLRLEEQLGRRNPLKNRRKTAENFPSNFGHSTKRRTEFTLVGLAAVQFRQFLTIAATQTIKFRDELRSLFNGKNSSAGFGKIRWLIVCD
jgi:hypothetical protein